MSSLCLLGFSSAAHQIRSFATTAIIINQHKDSSSAVVVTTQAPCRAEPELTRGDPPIEHPSLQDHLAVKDMDQMQPTCLKQESRQADRRYQDAGSSGFCQIVTSVSPQHGRRHALLKDVGWRSTKFANACQVLPHGQEAA